MRAAVAQICSTPNIAHNLATCTRVIRRAAAAGAQVSLPEASDFIARAPAVLSLTNLEDNVSFLEGLKTEARQAGVWLEAGIHTQSPDPQRVFNAHVLIDPQGALVQTYHKTHLFDVDIQGGTTILESRTTVPGDDLVPPQTTSVGRVGLLTCYDLRFPEPALRLRREGAELLTYPSAFTTRTGGAHWEVLLRARAIETQCYVLASAQTGTHFASEVHPEDGKTILPARQSYGHALIVDPWGTVVAQVADNPNQQEEPAFAIADIDLDWLQKCRTEIPLWQQRRGDIYPMI